jgi:CDP-diacylglycerol--glycerol-3-phosphate 3-phosphatidyltransferase
VACAGLAWLQEYVRARAGIAGMADIGTVTVAERPTRVLAVLFGLTLAGFAGALGGQGMARAAGLAGTELAAGAATVTAAIWAVLGLVGLVQLGAAVRRELIG